jgi:hypothetical protein
MPRAVVDRIAAVEALAHQVGVREKMAPRPALDALHDDHRRAVVRDRHVVHRNDVWMRQFCKRLGFTAEAFSDNWIIGNACAQQLDGDFTT